MFRLEVQQKRKGEIIDIKETVVFRGEDLNELTMLMVRMSQFEAKDTTYRIEREEETNE